MIVRVRTAAACLIAVAGSLAAAGCVNDYLYGEGESGTSTTVASSSGGMDHAASSVADASSGASASESASTTAEGDPSTSSSSSSSSSDSGGSDPTASTMGDGDPSGDSAGDPPFELCQGPCVANAMCGAEPDLCVELTEGDPVCLRACGRACPDGFTCQMRASVEGSSGEQCVPDGNICP